MVCFKIQCREFQKMSCNHESFVLHLSLSSTSEIFGPWPVGGIPQLLKWQLRIHISSLLPRGFAEFRGVSLPATCFLLAVTVSSIYRPSISISLHPHLRQ